MIGTLSVAFLLTWLLYSVNLLTFGWLLIPFLASLLMVGWWIGLFVSGILIQFGRDLQTIAWSGVYSLAPFSAIFYPVSSLPFWAQKIALILPSSYIFEGMREVILTGKIPFYNLTLSFLMNLFYIILGALFFKYCFKRSKQKGLARLQ